MGNNGMTPEQKMARLKELIAIELDSCNKLDWPYVCHMKDSKDGRKEIENMIIEQVKASGISVGQALDRIERAYNPNRMED
jgi:hypothetical protein